MKKLLLFLLALFSFNCIQAQDSTSSNSKALKHGLQFQIRSLSLTNFNNYSLAYRYLLSKKSGLRVGILTRINDEDSDLKRSIDSLVYNAPSTTEYYNLKFSIQYLHNLLYYDEFSLIIGAGPFIGYDKSKREYDSPQSDYLYSEERVDEGFYYGIDLLIGVEYKLSQNVILSGEYGVSFSVTKSNIKDFDKRSYYDSDIVIMNQIKGKSTEYAVSYVSASLGISVFF